MGNTSTLGMFQSTPDDATQLQADRASCPRTGIAAEFDPFSEEYTLDPFIFYKKARAEEPIFYDPQTDYWVVTEYDEIIRVFRKPETFSAALARHPVTPLCPAAAKVRDEQNIEIERSLVDEDPDSHRNHRKLFGDVFTPKRVMEVEPGIRKIVTNFIDKFENDGKAELVSQMLYEVPALAIFIFLGAKDEEALRVKQLGSARAVVNWGRPTDDEQVMMMEDIGEHWEFTKKLVQDAYEEPGDNYLGDMVRLHKSNPDLFTINYLRNVMFLMQFAGHETTTQASANGMRALLEDRQQWEALCDDSSLIPDAVEEILRYDSSIYTWRRITTCDTRIGDFDIPEGSKVLLAIGSGSRDSKAFANGDTFDIFRKQEKKHLAFGNGAHFCMGAPLARLEMKIILEELTRRLPRIRLVPEQEWEYIPSLTFRGLQKLPVEWDV